MNTKKTTNIHPAGFMQIVRDDGTTLEADTMRCVHCGKHWQVVPGSGRKRGWCIKCNGPLCGKELCMKSCYPVEKRLDDAEKGKIVMP
jgi:hypothetical protein